MDGVDDRGRIKGSQRSADRDRRRSRSPASRRQSRSRSRSRDRDRGGAAAARSGPPVAEVLAGVRQSLSTATSSVKSLEAEVKDSWSDSATSQLAASGGPIEVLEVELTNHLLQLEEGVPVDESEGTGLRKRVRELGERLARVKQQCMR